MYVAQKSTWLCSKNIKSGIKRVANLYRLRTNKSSGQILMKTIQLDNLDVKDGPNWTLFSYSVILSFTFVNIKSVRLGEQSATRLPQIPMDYHHVPSEKISQIYGHPPLSDFPIWRCPKIS